MQTSNRDSAGRFLRGTHWRAHAPFRDCEYLAREYVEFGRSAAEIAAEHGVTENAIFHWLHRHNIPRRTIAQARKIKRWGSVGEANPMFGKTGAANPRYVDGSSPERQRMYVQAIGRDFLKSVMARDHFCCRRCGSGKTGPRSLHVHHIRPWAGNPDLRFDESNALTLCRDCHSWVHSKSNIGREFLA